MKILYATDLHGHKKKYKAIAKEITDHDILILGADILPKHGDDTFADQDSFLHEFLPKFFEIIDIPIILDFGNDDYQCFYEAFKRVVKHYPHVHYSHLKEVKINDISFIGMQYVPDYPFRLKDWVRREHTSEFPTKSICKSQMGTGIVTDTIPRCPDNKIYCFNYIGDLSVYLGTKASIECCLKALPKPRNKTVHLIHTPPKMCGLDRTGLGMNVGSTALTQFILDTKPEICLHGHIHESPFHTGISKCNMEGTFCIQPGQIGDFKSIAFCEFDLDDIDGTYKHTTILKGNRRVTTV